MRRSYQGILAAALTVTSLPVLAEHTFPENNDYLQRDQAKTMIRELVAEGGDEARIRQVLGSAECQPKILESIARPAEKTHTWATYQKIFLQESRVQKAVEFAREHADTLTRAEQTYGVPREIILAIIGVETRYGQHMGTYRVVDALATLGFDYPPRASFFRKQLKALFELERTVERLDLGSCSIPERVDSSNPGLVGEANLAMMAAAATCDLSPVLVHQWGSGQDTRVFTELGLTDGHHALSHEPLTDAEAAAKLTAINTWYAERFADLLDRLSAVDAGDGGSLLDHSAVLWCNELGNAYIHEAANIPYVLAGRCGGSLDTGRFLQFDYRGHGELLAAIGQALGLGTTSFGMPEVYGSTLTEILS